MADLVLSRRWMAPIALDRGLKPRRNEGDLPGKCETGSVDRPNEYTEIMTGQISLAEKKRREGLLCRSRREALIGVCWGWEV